MAPPKAAPKMWDNNDDDEEEESMFSVKPKAKGPGLPPPPVPAQ
jgi:hypothetical protein